MSRVAVAGDRPTGRLHLGNLAGSLAGRAALQETHRCVFLVADLRALADPLLDIRGLSRELVLDWMSAGLDPGRSTFALQSLLPEIGELSLLLDALYPRLLGRAPRAADLLLFRPDEVPVGEEQAGDVEVAREIARRFNLSFGRVFTEPRAVVGRTLPGVDGAARMSKSQGNAIHLSDGPREVERRVRAMSWEAALACHAAFNPDRGEVEDLRRRCRPGDVEAKERLARVLNARLEPLRQRRRELERIDTEDLLREGSRRAREFAACALEEVRARVRLPPATGRSRPGSSLHA